MGNTIKAATVGEWYQKEYPTDELGVEINPTITFGGLKKNLPNAYEYLGVFDSIVRERIFTKLASLLDVDYYEVYDEWMNG